MSSLLVLGAISTAPFGVEETVSGDKVVAVVAAVDVVRPPELAASVVPVDCLRSPLYKR
ncbi:MAG: hypothetical protein JJE47_08660 [Acidimicrobiia bacterium]|nr:hypothetical protein [Acidimicrobiia bacterium]